AADLAAEAEVVAGLANLIAEVIRVVPQDIDADIHARGEDIPQIPLSQENCVAVELVDRPADSGRKWAGCGPGTALNAPRPCIRIKTSRTSTSTIHIDLGTLKVRANQNRAGRRRRTGQEPFGAPNVQIIADQPAMGALIGPCTTVIVPAFRRKSQS